MVRSSAASSSAGRDRPESAEAFVRRYLRLRESLTASPSPEIAAVRGWIYAERCAHCGHAKRKEVYNARARAHVMRCAKCSKGWHRTLGFIPRAALDGGPRPDPHARLAELATAAQIIGKLDTYERLVFVAFCCWKGPGRADLGIALEARDALPEAPWPWTQYRVRELVASARTTIERELDRIRRGRT